MPVQITILGLGPLGASLGLALSPSKEQITRVGSDASSEIMRQALKAGAVDRTVLNLPQAVREADGVVLCLPPSELRKTMEAIRQDLKPGAVVLDTSPVPLLSTTWAEELFPAENCYFLSFTPAINPAYLEEAQAASHEDAFKNANIFIAHPFGIDPSAITFAENFARLIGGTPVFSEVHEVEGLLALTRWLPALTAAAIQGAAASQPGWKEARRLAGADFAFSGLPLVSSQDGASAGLGLVHARENALRMVDLVIEELNVLRGLIAEGKEDELVKRLENTLHARQAWLRQRAQAKWEEEEEKPASSSSLGSTLGRLIGIRPRDPKNKG